MRVSEKDWRVGCNFVEVVTSLPHFPPFLGNHIDSTECLRLEVNAMETERVVECFSAAVSECIEAESDMHVSEV